MMSYILIINPNLRRSGPYSMDMKFIGNTVTLGHWHRSHRKIIFGFTFALLAVLFFAGCGKTNSSSSAKITAQDTNPPAGSAKDHLPIYMSPSVARANDVLVSNSTTTNTAPDLAELDRGLLQWILRNRRRPDNFADFAATAGIHIPPPPKGKKYVIAKNMHIQLVDR
jgi:hypothetical protein